MYVPQLDGGLKSLNVKVLNEKKIYTYINNSSVMFTFIVYIPKDGILSLSLSIIYPILSSK